MEKIITAVIVFFVVLAVFVLIGGWLELSLWIADKTSPLVGFIAGLGVPVALGVAIGYLFDN